MAFTQSSRPIQHQDTWVDPISQDLLLKGAIFTNQNIEKNSKEASSVLDMLHNIPSLPGADTEKKNEIMNNVMKQASQLSYHDLRSPSAVNQLKSYVSQVASSPDIQGIAERAYKYKNDLDTYNSLLQKGKPVSEWRQKSLKDAQNYIASNTYLRDKRFNGEIVEDPDIQKWLMDTPKMVGEDSYIKYDPETKMYKTITGKDPSKVLNAYIEGAKQDPKIAAYYKDLFNTIHEGENFNDNADEYFNDGIKKATLIYNDPKATQEQRAKALNSINTFTAYLNSPTKGEKHKELVQQAWLQDQFTNEAIAASSHIEKQEIDELYKMRLQNNMTAAREENNIKLKARLDNSGGYTTGNEIDNELNHFKENFVPYKDKTGKISNTSINHDHNGIPYNVQGIPPVFKSKVFEKTISTPSIKTETKDAKSQTPEINVITSNQSYKASPVAVEYDKDNKTYVLTYPDKSQERIAEEGVKDYVLGYKQQKTNKGSSTGLSEEEYNQIINEAKLASKNNNK